MTANSGQPLVTIAVPTYNRPVSLRRTLNCIRRQTYSNIEVILSNNCSTDPAVEKVISEYLAQDKRVKYFQQPVNMGSLKNQKFILEQATGDFFMSFHDDDWIADDYIEKCIVFLVANPEYSFAYGLTVICTLEEKFTGYDVNTDFGQDSTTERLRSYYTGVAYNGPFYGVIRKELKEFALAEKKLGDDWFIVARYLAKGKGKLVKETNLYLAEGGVSKTIMNIVTSFHLSGFARLFPYFSISINVAKDILFRRAYREIGFFKRVKTACQCFSIVYRRFSVTLEIKRRLAGQAVFFL